MTNTHNTFADLEDAADKADNSFGDVIYAYTRAQAIADGVLVDITETDAYRESGFRFPVAMTDGAYHACIVAGGKWVPAIPAKDESGYEVLELPGGQSVDGRLWDVLTMLRFGIRKAGNTDRVTFAVLVDVNGDGRHETVKLWSLCGPGDNAEPVITIMLEGED